MRPTTDSAAPGRSCPIRYRYPPAAIAAVPPTKARVLYVIGGLYGNVQALATIEAMAAEESSPVTLVFNGDFHWFDSDDRDFRLVTERVLRHDATLGNVEAELFAEDAAAGCGCAYPESVDQETVHRSNAIHARLRGTAGRHPDLLAQLARLPLFARYQIGHAIVAVVHGDCRSLSGWTFDIDALSDTTPIDLSLAATEADVIASSHTCLPVMRQTSRGVLANNGSAGMPNFLGDRCGVITRVAASEGPHPALYGTVVKEIRVDALAVRYDTVAWQQLFLANWPPGSPAHRSYWPRITDGPSHTLERARP